MTNNNHHAPSAAVIYLAACVINGIKPDALLIEPVAVGEIYSAALKNSLDAIITTALEAIGVTSPRASERKLMAVRRAVLFDNARAEILSKFEEEKIKYLPLKGIIMKEYYPAIGLRQMSDNDILIDSSRRADVRRIMEALGYSSEYYEVSNHDVYHKPPVLNFEMHAELFGPDEDRGFCDYYADLLDRLPNDGGRPYGYRFEDNDYYIYLKAHEYKHFSSCGTGLRSLLDSYVFLKAKGDSLDFGYISAECRKLGMEEYERDTRLLAKELFSPEISAKLVTFALGGGDCPFSEDMLSLLFEFIKYGTYGTLENNISNQVSNEGRNAKTAFGARVIFLLKRIFPPVAHFTVAKPRRKGKAYLYPIWWIGRLFEIIFTRPKRTAKTIKDIFKAKIKKQ